MLVLCFNGASLLDGRSVLSLTVFGEAVAPNAKIMPS